MSRPESAEAVYDVREVRRAVTELPREEREIVRLRHFEGLTHTHLQPHVRVDALRAGPQRAVQVQRWLGRLSPAFTLATYVHLLDCDLGGPLVLDHDWLHVEGIGAYSPVREVA
jgi:hypothetical protein